MQSGASVPLRVMVRKLSCDGFGQQTKPAIGHVLSPLRVIVGFVVSASRNPLSPANHSTRYDTLSIFADFFLLHLVNPSSVTQTPREGRTRVPCGKRRPHLMDELRSIWLSSVKGKGRILQERQAHNIISWFL